VVLGVALPAVG
jgi:hypothetical protein